MEGYKNLTTYILATVIYDSTVEFCKRWINSKSRTYDQMEQGARSGKQNIAEGYTFQSLESYIKLCGVAEGSIKELAADYEDFLRQNNLKIWSKDDPRVRAFRDFRAIWVAPNLPNTPISPVKYKAFFLKGKSNLLRQNLLKKAALEKISLKKELGLDKKFKSY